MARRTASSGCRNSVQELDILQLAAACTGPYAPPVSLTAGHQLEPGERTIRRHETLLGRENRSSAHPTGGNIAWRRISPPTGTDPYWAQFRIGSSRRATRIACLSATAANPDPIPRSWAISSPTTPQISSYDMMSPEEVFRDHARHAPHGLPPRLDCRVSVRTMAQRAA